MNAMDRFKRRLADALEYACVLEERLEQAAELAREQADTMEALQKENARLARALKRGPRAGRAGGTSE